MERDTARHRGRMTQLFAATVFLVGCVDSSTTGPQLRDQTLPESLNVTAISTVETLSGSGQPDKHAVVSQRLSSKKIRGKFRAYISDTDPKYNPDAQYDPAVTPVLYLPANDLWEDFDETMVDSAGRLIRVVARGPSTGWPIDNVWVWVNGAPAVHMKNHWRLATGGGYNLVDQTITGFGGTFTPVVRVTSVIDGYTAVYTSNALTTQLGSVAASTLNKIDCWLLPSLAFAELSGCTRQAVMFTGETFVLGVGGVALVPTLDSPLAPWTSAAYIAGWGLWTSALYDLLHCLHSQHPRPKRPAFPENTTQFGF